LFFVSLLTRIYIGQQVGQFSVEQLAAPDGSTLAGYLELLPTTYLYLFLAGMLLHMMVEYRGIRPIPRLQPLLASVLFSVSALFLMAFPYLFGSSQAMQSTRGGLLDLVGVTQSPPRILLDLMVVAFFASLLLGTPLLRSVLRWRPLVFVGMISYSLFLLHETIIVIAFRPLLKDIRGWIMGQEYPMVWAAFSVYVFAFLAAAIAVAYISYRCIESPFLQYKPK